MIDGTEHCPGKQGINLVVFDIINFHFQKGRVIDTNELLGFFENQVGLKSKCRMIDKYVCSSAISRSPDFIGKIICGWPK